MVKIRKSLICFISVLIILPILIAGCTDNLVDNDNIYQKWDYRPMISKEDYIYGDTGKVKNTLPEDFIYLGIVEEKVSQTETMVKGKTFFVSNSLPVDTDIYGHDQLDEVIYADYNGSFIRYELIEK